MEHLALEVFDLAGTGSMFATLHEDASIKITETSEIFESGDVWSYSFQLNIPTNAHIFGTAGELRGSRLHEQINKRRARLWSEGLPLHIGYMKLEEEVDVDVDGNVDIIFESGRKTFDGMLDGLSARDVSVGDVVIGVAVERHRVINIHAEGTLTFNKEGETEITDSTSGYTCQLPDKMDFSIETDNWTAHTQQWPKMVISQGTFTPYGGSPKAEDWTNVQTAYDDSHPFCNINICYQKKYKVSPDDVSSEEKAARGYIVRLAHGEDTVLGGDNETRYNNAPNFYLLHWLKRLFMDKSIHVIENQMLNVEDMRRIFLLNMGCFYDERNLWNDDGNLVVYPRSKREYTHYQLTNDAMINTSFKTLYIDEVFKTYAEKEDRGKVLLRNIKFKDGSSTVATLPTRECLVERIKFKSMARYLEPSDHADDDAWLMMAPEGYTAYATSDNYPKVDAVDIIKATESAFGVRFLFNDDFSQVRIVLLRNLFSNNCIQEIACEIIDAPTKEENCIRGFCMTYGGGEDDTNYNYAEWGNVVDTLDYDTIRNKRIATFNKTCYFIPETGNAYRIKVDKNEDVFFPVLTEVAGYIDAKDGDCTGEEATIKKITVGMRPLIMNDVDGIYAVLSNEDMNAPGKTEVAGQMYLGTKTITGTTTASVGGTKTDLTIEADADIFMKEGYVVNLQDNYNLSGDEDTPFDKADVGLTFGIMRSSGRDAYINYQLDTIGDEGNYWWEVVPGSGAIDHPDTCDNYGNQWDYNGRSSTTVNGAENAQVKLSELWPASGRNAPFIASDKGYVNGAGIFYIFINGERHTAILVTSYSVSGRTMFPLELTTYPEYLSGGHSAADVLALDRAGSNGLSNLILELDSSQERCNTLLSLCQLAYGSSTIPIGIDNGIGVTEGRFSLKLRAEKPNPNYDPTLDRTADKYHRTPVTTLIVRTKEEAAYAMTQIYKSSNANLLARHKVSDGLMALSGWTIEGTYATLHSMQIGVETDDEGIVEILWSPIRPTGSVLSPEELNAYITQWGGGRMTLDDVIAADKAANSLIIDVNTSVDRAVTLSKLQAIYYAGVDDKTESVSVTINHSDWNDTTILNPPYLEIANPDLRGRGLADQFYKEYSYWVRNARIAKIPVQMTLAQLLAIDKTVRIRVGDITGFIRTMQYTISNKTGLGQVIMEIMYI